MWHFSLRYVQSCFWPKFLRWIRRSYLLKKYFLTALKRFGNHFQNINDESKKCSPFKQCKVSLCVPHMLCTENYTVLVLSLSYLSGLWAGNIQLLSSVFGSSVRFSPRSVQSVPLPPALVWITFTIETPPYNFRERLLHTSDGGQFATPFRDDSFWFGTVQGVYKTKLTIIEFNWQGVKVNSSRAHKLDSGTFRVPFLFVTLVFGAIRRGDTWSKSN